MENPLQVSFVGMEPDEELRSLVREEVAALEKFHTHITGCRVAIAGSETRHRQGQVHKVTIRITIPPRREIVVNQSPGNEGRHHYPEATVRDAFEVARRRLEDEVGRLRGQVKRHAR